MALLIAPIVLWFQPRWTFFFAIMLAAGYFFFPRASSIEEFFITLLAVNWPMLVILAISAGVVALRKRMLRREKERMEAVADAALAELRAKQTPPAS